jgi:hypothetical protein
MALLVVTEPVGCHRYMTELLVVRDPLPGRLPLGLGDLGEGAINGHLQP